MVPARRLAGGWRILRVLCEVCDKGLGGNAYFNLNGRPVAKYIGGVADGEAFFFHANPIGSTSMITYYNGDVVQKELFYPYGQLWATGGNIGSYRFAGLREYFPVSDSAEIFMSQSRDYPARFYRWMSPDEFTGGPIDAVNASFGGPDATPPGPLPYADILNPQSLNKYQYAYNNPLRYNDPLGRDAWDVLLGFANAISSNAGASERIDSGNEDLQRGQFVGDVASVAVGSTGALGFGTAAVATEAGTLAIATPVAVAEAGVAAQLGKTAASGLYHLAKSAESGGQSSSDATSKRISGRETSEAAGKLGYNKRISPQKAPFDSHGQPVFQKGNRFITPDRDMHKGGVWKMFERVGRQFRRKGTFDKDLNRIGD